MRKLFNILGTVFVVIAVFFLFEKVWANRQWFLEGRITKQIMTMIGAGSVVYALSSFLLSKAWARFLSWFGEPPEHVKYCHAIYARTQIAKYVPGNVFHYAGRHVLGTRVGISHGPLAGAAVYEISGLLVAASSLAIIGLVFYGVEQLTVSVLGLAGILSGTLLIPVLMNKMIIRFPGLKKYNFKEKKIGEIVTYLIPTYLLYGCFFLATGAILLVIVYYVSGTESMRVSGYVVTAFAVAWIAGNVTPGASAGVGIREAVMVVAFSRMIGEPQSLFVAIILRMITVAGDFLYFLTSLKVKLGPDDERSGKGSVILNNNNDL